MNWLKLIGLGILKAQQMFTGFSPLIKAGLSDRGDRVVDRIEDSLSDVATVVVQVEAIGAALQLSGTQKLTAATPLVAQLILKSDLMLGKKIDNPVLFNEGCGDLATGIVKILNSIKDA
jgi:hypothetical protein